MEQENLQRLTDAFITLLTGGGLVALINFITNRRKNISESDKVKAETEKLDTESLHTYIETADDLVEFIKQTMEEKITYQQTQITSLNTQVALLKTEVKDQRTQVRKYELYIMLLSGQLSSAGIQPAFTLSDVEKMTVKDLEEKVNKTYAQ